MGKDHHLPGHCRYWCGTKLPGAPYRNAESRTSMFISIVVVDCSGLWTQDASLGNLLNSTCLSLPKGTNSPTETRHSNRHRDLRFHPQPRLRHLRRRRLRHLPKRNESPTTHAPLISRRPNSILFRRRCSRRKRWPHQLTSRAAEGRR